MHKVLRLAGAGTQQIEITGMSQRHLGQEHRTGAAHPSRGQRISSVLQQRFHGRPPLSVFDFLGQPGHQRSEVRIVHVMQRSGAQLVGRMHVRSMIQQQPHRSRPRKRSRQVQQRQVAGLVLSESRLKRTSGVPRFRVFLGHQDDVGIGSLPKQPIERIQIVLNNRLDQREPESCALDLLTRSGVYATGLDKRFLRGLLGPAWLVA